jgi:hypothetical protein
MVQLSNSGGYTTETLNKHGLAHPWGALGLAQGMWKEPEKSMFPDIISSPASPSGGGVAKGGNPRGTMVGGAVGSKEEEPPNPIFFLLYAVILPLAPVAQLIAGDTNNAISRFADLTIIPLGFMFYLFAMLYDYWILFTNPADLLVAGSKRFFPFTYLGMDADGHSPLLTGVSEIKPCPPDNMTTTLLRISVPLVSYFFPGIGKTIQGALDTKDTIVSTVTTAKEVVVDKGMAKVAQVTDTAAKVGSLSTSIASGVATSVAKAGTAAANPASLITEKVGELAPEPIRFTSAPPPASAPAPVQGVDFKEYNSHGNPRGTMVGGARPEGRRLETKATFNTLDYAALGSLAAVIGGALVLSANRFRNVFFPKENDSPPDPRAVRDDVY